MRVWTCGKVNGIRDWEFQGVFSTREKAIAACKDRNWFIAPALLDEELPETAQEPPGLEWPLINAPLNSKRLSEGIAV